MVSWIILDPSTLIILGPRLSMHIIVLMAIIYLFAVADYVDLTCIYIYRDIYICLLVAVTVVGSFTKKLSIIKFQGSCWVIWAAKNW